MALWTAVKLSGSTDGKGIKVAATAIGSGTTVHTADSTALDFINLYAINTDSAARQLTIGWGGTTSPDDTIVQSIPSKSGLVPVALRIPLTNSLIVKAAADTANVVILFGEVRRYS
jgi:hypothetical protein